MPQIKKENGNIYNNLQVIKEASSKNGRKYWICECIHCKKQFIFSGTQLRTGKCLCKNCELINQKFGNLTVINYAYTDKDRHKYWKCQCHCGNIEIIRASDLKTNKKIECSECKKQHRKVQYINEKGNQYGRLTVLDIDIDRSGKNTYWLCECQCGNQVSVLGTKLRFGHTSSCGCIKSKGEEKISSILHKANINFKSQVILSGCKDKDFLKFDFGIYQNDKLIYVIEYDGKQHFEPVPIWGGYETYQDIQKRDKIKNEYCKNYNIPLIRIPYTHFNNLDIQDLVLSTTKFLVR